MAKMIKLNLIAIVLLLTGCGQTGPLYFPPIICPVTCVEYEEKLIPKYRIDEEESILVDEVKNVPNEEVQNVTNEEAKSIPDEVKNVPNDEVKAEYKK